MAGSPPSLGRKASMPSLHQRLLDLTTKSAAAPGAGTPGKAPEERSERRDSTPPGFGSSAGRGLSGLAKRAPLQRSSGSSAGLTGRPTSSGRTPGPAAVAAAAPPNASSMSRRPSACASTAAQGVELLGSSGPAEKLRARIQSRLGQDSAWLVAGGKAAEAGGVVASSDSGAGVATGSGSATSANNATGGGAGSTGGASSISDAAGAGGGCGGVGIAVCSCSGGADGNDLPQAEPAFAEAEQAEEPTPTGGSGKSSSTGCTGHSKSRGASCTPSWCIVEALATSAAEEKESSMQTASGGGPGRRLSEHSRRRLPQAPAQVGAARAPAQQAVSASIGGSRGLQGSKAASGPIYAAQSRGTSPKTSRFSTATRAASPPPRASQQPARGPLSSDAALAIQNPSSRGRKSSAVAAQASSNSVLAARREPKTLGRRSAMGSSQNRSSSPSGPLAHAASASVPEAIEAGLGSEMLQVYSDIFEEVICRDKQFGSTLRKVKTIYDAFLAENSSAARSCEEAPPGSRRRNDASSSGCKSCAALGASFVEVERENRRLRGLLETLRLTDVASIDGPRAEDCGSEEEPARVDSLRATSQWRPCYPPSPHGDAGTPGGASGEVTSIGSRACAAAGSPSLRHVDGGSLLHPSSGVAANAWVTSNGSCTHAGARMQLPPGRLAKSSYSWVAMPPEAPRLPLSPPPSWLHLRKSASRGSSPTSSPCSAEASPGLERAGRGRRGEKNSRPSSVPRLNLTGLLNATVTSDGDEVDEQEEQHAEDGDEAFEEDFDSWPEH
ncbi:unnamed protein product [Polarella glacialis]|uniref:Uncharacterized protein n=1 Tax=Polarella glacialis TaxID=89957 RepID=A0A813EYS8_POLGL|nr:unnamed protein product [Polarella glacialis]